MKIGNEKQELNRLKKVWCERVDIDAKEFTYIEAALMRARRLLILNHTWNDLRDAALRIATKVDTCQLE